MKKKDSTPGPQETQPAVSSPETASSLPRFVGLPFAYVFQTSFGTNRYLKASDHVLLIEGDADFECRQILFSWACRKRKILESVERRMAFALPTSAFVNFAVRVPERLVMIPTVPALQFTRGSQIRFRLQPLEAYRIPSQARGGRRVHLDIMFEGVKKYSIEGNQGSGDSGEKPQGFAPEGSDS